MNIVLIGLFLMLLLIGVPIWLALAVPCTVVILWAGIPLALLVQRIVVALDSFILLAVPLFMLSGKLMNNGGITKRIVTFCNNLVGHITGGLAQVNIVASMFFAGISGSAVADVSGIGTMLIPSMVEEEYDADFSVAVTAASSMVGPIIPPSIPLVLAGSLAGVSVGRLFLGGVIPGVILGFALMFVTHIISKRRNYPRGPRASFRAIVQSFRESFFALLMPILILGGIFGGIFTPTEAAVISVVYSIVTGVLIYRELTFSEVWHSLVAVSKEISVILYLIALSSLYSYVLTMQQIPQKLTSSILLVSSNPTIVLLLVNAMLLFLGCFISTTPAVILTVPVLYPLAKTLGIDPVHFLVVVVFNLCIAMLTPPVGTVLFVTSRIGNISVERAGKALIPFLAVLVVVLLMITMWPPLVTWLPNCVIR